MRSARGRSGGQSWPFEACYSAAWWPSPPWNVAGDGLDLTCKTPPVRTFFTSNTVQFVWGGKNNRNSLKSGGYNFTSLQLGAIKRDNIKQDYRVLAWNPQMILHSWNFNLATGLALWEKSKYHDQETEIFIVLLSYMTNHLRPLAVKISVITIFISNDFCLPTPSSLCLEEIVTENSSVMSNLSRPKRDGNLHDLHYLLQPSSRDAVRA